MIKVTFQIDYVLWYQALRLANSYLLTKMYTLSNFWQRVVTKMAEAEKV